MEKTTKSSENREKSRKKQRLNAEFAIQ